jgi:hypothetical protein
LQEKVNALGTRLFTPGQERVILIGTLQRNGATTPVTVTFQLPNKVKVDFGQGQVVGFDGSTSWDAGSTVTSDDQALLEALSDDAPETFFYNAAAQTHRLRPLAHRARMDDGTATNYSGPWMDIYQEIGVPIATGEKGTRVKHFYFDSITHLPNRVRYILPTGSRVEVLRSGWTKSSGQYIPVQISRYQDGALTHSFIGTSATVMPAANDSTFAH